MFGIIALLKMLIYLWVESFVEYLVFYLPGNQPRCFGTLFTLKPIIGKGNRRPSTTKYFI